MCKNTFGAKNPFVIKPMQDSAANDISFDNIENPAKPFLNSTKKIENQLNKSNVVRKASTSQNSK